MAVEVEKITSQVPGIRIVLIMEYDGASYYGFQLQANQPTIQGEIEKAWYKLTGERVRVMAASRTDTGVHAEGQAVSFNTNSSLPMQTFVNGLNYYLPCDIAAKAAFRVADTFNVRRDAISREYNYYILNSPTQSPIRRSFAYLVTGRLDIEVMNQACQSLVGEHDFTSFTTLDEARTGSTVRHVHKAEVKKNKELVIFNIVANSFLRHQVRNMVGSLVRVGLGKMTVDEFYDTVESGEPGLGGPRAPAHGLCLMQINYPGYFGEDTTGDN